jgi:protein involved in polysaccharide export with SLBB domain
MIRKGVSDGQRFAKRIGLNTVQCCLSRSIAFVGFFCAVAILADAQTAHRRNVAATSMDELDNQTPIQVGDQLIFRVLEDEEPSSSLTVNDSGQVRVPYLGSITAINRTPRDLAYQIKHALEKKLFKRATVLLLVEKKTARSPGKIYITGEVARPGALELRGNESLTLSQAILEAGGFSDYANRRKVKVTRRSGAQSEAKIIDVAAVIDQGRTDLDFALKPGDVVIVPQRFLNW